MVRANSILVRTTDRNNNKKMDAIENYWKMLDEINKTIKIAETKGIAIISTSGISTAFLFSKDDLEIYSKGTVFSIAFILCILFLFLAILFALLCVKPNFTNKSIQSVFYFNALIEMQKNNENIEKKLDHVLGNENELKAQLSEQLIIKSKIAKRKFKFNNYSFYSYIAFLSILLILLIVK